MSAKGDWEGWISYCLRGTIDQAKDAIRRLDKLVELKKEYSNRVAHVKGSIRLQKVIETLFEIPAVSIPHIAEMCNITYPTAKRDVELLIGEKILSESSLPYHPKLFLANEIINIAYKDAEF